MLGQVERLKDVISRCSEADMARCEYCGFENPNGALVCRQCRRRLRPRTELAGPRRETEAELTRVVARELARLAFIVGGILILGTVLAFPLYRRVEPALVITGAIVVLLGLLARRSAISARPE